MNAVCYLAEEEEEEEERRAEDGIEGIGKSDGRLREKKKGYEDTWLGK